MSDRIEIQIITVIHCPAINIEFFCAGLSINSPL